MNPQAEHHQKQIAKALRTNYLCLAMFDAVGRELNISNRMQIPQAMARAEMRLENYWKTGEICYVDIQDITRVANQAAHEIWNPQADTFVQRIAVHAVNTDAKAWQHDAILRGEPYVNNPGDIVGIDEDILTANESLKSLANQSVDNEVDSLKRQIDINATQSALEARKTLATLQNESPTIVIESRRDHSRLPSINTVTASQLTISAWIHSMAATDAIPPASTLQPLLKSALNAESDGVPVSLINDTADQWQEILNGAPAGWAHQTVSNLVDVIIQDNIRDAHRNSVEVVTDILADATESNPNISEGYSILKNQISSHRHMQSHITKAREIGNQVDQALDILKRAIRSSPEVKFGREFAPNSRAEKQIAEELNTTKENLIRKLESLPENFDDLISEIVDAGVAEAHHDEPVYRFG